MVASSQSHTAHAHTHTYTYTYCRPVNYAWIVHLNSFLAQLGNTALLAAAFGDSDEMMRMLLKDFCSSLDEVDDVSVYHPKFCSDLDGF